MANFAAKIDFARKQAASVERLEHFLRSDPQNRKLLLSLSAAKKRAALGEAALQEMALARQIRVVRYKIQNESNLYPALSVSDSISSFQRAITAVFDAKSSGPKNKAKFSRAVKQATRLNFAYSFSGSFGAVLTMAAEEDLLGLVPRPPLLDAFPEVARDFLEVRDGHEALDASHAIGLAAVSRIFSWFSVNAKWGNSVDFIWKKHDGSELGQHVPANKFIDLTEIFEETIDLQKNEFSISGILVGIDVDDGTFHFVVPGGDSFKGKLANEFDRGPTTVGNHYHARIKTEEKRFIATGKTDSTDYLLNLKLPDDA